MRATIDRLLDRLEALKTVCDLDLLVFFHRHPRALLTSEELAAFVGYDVQQIARSLDALIAGGLVTRSPNRTRRARMYLLKLATDGSPAGGWISSLFRLTETGEGRAAVLRAIRARGGGTPTAIVHRVRRSRAIAA
jgi:hypothetical protein